MQVSERLYGLGHALIIFSSL